MAILGPSRPFLAIFRPFLRKISDRNLLNQFVWCQASPDTTLEYPQRVLCWNLKMAILGPSRPFSGHFSAILTKDWLSNFIKSLCMMSGIFWHSFRVPTKGTLLKLQKWPFWAQIGHFSAILTEDWWSIFIKSLCMMSDISWYNFRVPTKGTLLKLGKWPFWALLGHFRPFLGHFG